MRCSVLSTVPAKETLVLRTMTPWQPLNSLHSVIALRQHVIVLAVSLGPQQIISWNVLRKSSRLAPRTTHSRLYFRANSTSFAAESSSSLIIIREASSGDALLSAFFTVPAASHAAAGCRCECSIGYSLQLPTEQAQHQQRGSQCASSGEESVWRNCLREVHRIGLPVRRSCHSFSSSSGHTNM